MIVRAKIKSPRGGTAQGSNAAASERARLLREKCKDGYEVGEAWPCLQRFAGKPGKVFLRNEILNQVWGTEVIVGDRTIDVHIRKIRQKLNLDCITTVKGVGYKFEM